MHDLFSGLMGFFLGIGGFFHGGAAVHSSINQPQPSQQVNTIGTPSGIMNRGYGFGHKKNLPNGERPFLGTVTNVNGSTLTIQGQGRMMGNGQTITVDLTANTQYKGGSQSDIKSGSRIAGYGIANSDGSINAQQVMINQMMPNREQLQKQGENR